jgi:two-component system LytT family response regulator
MEMDNRIRAVIAEDEPLARDKLASMLAELSVDVVGVCGEGHAAVEAISSLRPDLVLLDIQMPNLDGFGVVEEIGIDEMPVTIFVTALDQFALRAFEVNALDYLLKPYDQDRLAASVDRARRLIRSRRETSFHEQLQELMTTVRGLRSYPARFMVKAGEQYIFVQSQHIEWIDAADNYVALHAGGRSYLVRETIASIGEKLDPARFVRVRASAIVNFDFVTALKPWSGTEYQIIMRDGTKLVSSRRYRPRLKEFLT